MSNIYASISGVTEIFDISVSESHSSATSTAIVNSKSTTLDIGDAIAVDLGYLTDHEVIFNGWVKQIERTVPEDVVTITASDELIKAVDFYIAPDDPDAPFSRSNIPAEFLVRDVLLLAQVSNYEYQETNYTLAVGETAAEVKLISSYDYCRSIANLIAWNLWADRSGKVLFKNRKPYVMDGLSSQPGDVADVSILTITDAEIDSISYTISERDLRNRVVVWGADDIKFTASIASPHLPAGFFKTILFSNRIIDTDELAIKTANYNLELFNRLNKNANVTVTGDTTLQARTVITLNETTLGLNQDAYVFSCQHRLGSGGYTCSLELRLS